ncbi:MAG: hypothetical protein IAF02_06670 [Anaerolineae bacterium]|nr:hypothetical protein [Anaerolineae bacterium]
MKFVTAVFNWLVLTGLFRLFNREQQANITQDFYGLRTQGKDVAAYEPFITQVRAREIQV